MASAATAADAVFSFRRPGAAAVAVGNGPLRTPMRDLAVRPRDFAERAEVFAGGGPEG